jgi:hypothetical protein
MSRGGFGLRDAIVAVLSMTPLPAKPKAFGVELSGKGGRKSPDLAVSSYEPLPPMGQGTF